MTCFIIYIYIYIYIYILCKQNLVPRTIKETGSVSGIGVKLIGSYERVIYGKYV